MTNNLKLAVLGGSSVASPELIRVLAERVDRPSMDVVLLGRNEAKLDKVAAVSARLAAQAAVPLRVTRETDLRRGLAGADYVLNQVRVGGYQARAFDESFPHAFGLPGEETFGPGGFNNARRTLPVTLEHCRLIEQAAPDALLINLTNPSSFIQYAVARYTQVHVVGVCDAPITMTHIIADALGAAPSDLWIGYVGMHHFGWVTAVRRHGRDALPDALARADALAGLGVDARVIRAVGAIPSPYFKYYYHPDRMLAAQLGRRTRGEQLIELEAHILADFEAPGLEGIPASLSQRRAHWYEDIVVPVLLAHANDARSIHVVNITNYTAVPWLTPDTIVELPAVVGRHGFQPLTTPGAPPDVQALVRHNAAAEMLWVEAVVERSYDKALRAMRLNHLVQNIDQARGLLDEIWNRAE